jgi:hypothetical protein
MKGMLFGGCSYTWGQGLYFYSDLPHLYNSPSIYEFPGHKVVSAQIRFKNTLYYPRLVANHFNTFEVVKPYNGGSDDESFQFFKDSFTKVIDIVSPNYHFDKYSYDEFDYFIIQLSGILRNRFYFNIDDKIFSCKLDTKIMDHKMIEYMKINNYTFEDCYEQFINQQYERLKKELMFYENKGIKTKIMLWFDDLLGLIKNDEFLNQKLVQLHYDNKVVYTIKELQDNYAEMTILTDPYFENNKINDWHPSKLLHRIMADGIIKSIEGDIK